MTKEELENRPDLASAEICLNCATRIGDTEYVVNDDGIPMHRKCPTTYTPGPWQAVDLGEGRRGKPLGICIYAPLPLFILPGTTDTQKANARLVAAAPDLLEALEHLVKECEECRTAAFWLGEAHVAIKKAKRGK